MVGVDGNKIGSDVLLKTGGHTASDVTVEAGGHITSTVTSEAISVEGGGHVARVGWWAEFTTAGMGNIQYRHI